VAQSLAGRVALITGGGTGIGRSTAEQMAAQGATVIVVGRRQAPLDEVVAAIGDKASAITADLADPSEAERLAAEVLAVHGRVDILVNNAGFSSKVRNPRYADAEEWRAVMDVNTLGPMILTRELLPSMSANGGGDVVLVSSMAALRPNVMAGVAYSAAKAAARAYMQVLTEEVRSEGIRCTTVFPGEVDTPILDNRPLPPDAAARATMMMPEDIAEAIVLAVALPRRTTMLEVTLGATHPRDMREDVRVAREKRAVD
jgi:NAD(P)-dependent dehydrogenase (short-subunit alcohol dehydrogenase family)